MSGLKKSPYFSSSDSGNKEIPTTSTSQSVSVSASVALTSAASNATVRKSVPASAENSVVTKRSRFFEPKHHHTEKAIAESNNNSTDPNPVTVVQDSSSGTKVACRLSDFDDILRRFKASRSRLRSLDLSKEINKGGDEDETCPICLCNVSFDERASPNGCSHVCFCFTCLEAWGKVVNKCPLCKSTFTEVISVSNPQQKILFQISNRTRITDQSDSDGSDIESYVNDGQEMGVLFGYDESDGFVVGEDVVEYESEVDDGLLDI